MRQVDTQYSYSYPGERLGFERALDRVELQKAHFNSGHSDVQPGG